MNVTTRRLSDAELWKSYELVDAILKKKKEDGQKFGKIRETLASYLSVSPAQVGKMQYVERNAISEVKEAVENGEISISTANEIAKLDEDEQEELVQNTDLSSVKHKDIKKRNAALKPETEEAEKVDICSNFSDEDEEDDEPDAYDTEDTVPEVSEIHIPYDAEIEQEIHDTEETIKKFGRYIVDNHKDLSSISSLYLSSMQQRADL